MPDLADFKMSDMITCSAALRIIGEGESSMEAVAAKIVRYLHDELVDVQSGEPCCALVRFYKTHAYAELDEELQAYARVQLGEDGPSAGMKCLTLLATAGSEPEWNSRTASRSHRAIPLPSAHVVAQAPMIGRLIEQFGLEFDALLLPESELMLDHAQTTYNVFYVAEAEGSPYIPAQEDFVIPHGIRSVLGFGGLLPAGDLFATILFSKVAIAPETAEMFRTLAVSAKVAVLPFDRAAVFAEASPGLLS